MIRLLEDEEFIPPIYIPKDIKLYDVVKCAGYEWYIIDIDNDAMSFS